MLKKYLNGLRKLQEYLASFTSDPKRLSADIRQKESSAWWKAGDNFLQENDHTKELPLVLKEKVSYML